MRGGLAIVFPGTAAAALAPALVATAWTAFAAAQTPTAPAAPQPFAATVAAVDSFATVRLTDGRVVRLQGLSLPAAPVRPPSFADDLAAFVRARLAGKSVWVSAEPDDGRGGELTAVVRVGREDPSVNEDALRAGVALLSCRTEVVRELDALRAAAADAQRHRRGWFDRPFDRAAQLPYLNGAVLGLHFQSRRRDYHERLDELATAGFRHVCFLFTGFVADATATAVERDDRRTVGDERLLETIAYAKGKGMTVMLLPILLLREVNDDDWRGTLRPADAAAFWRSYDEFLCHYVDLAEASGADIVAIGSELGSLEHDDEAWRRLIVHARGRYRGWLTYSANWDHVHVPRFWGQLDFVGMTAYYALTDENDPTAAALAAGWRSVAARLERSVGALGKPVVFTEIGYPSQDGANRRPWDYVSNRAHVDVDEQAQCTAAFVDAAPSMPFLRGAYLYDFFDPGGTDDGSYSPRGKPAMSQWQRWARLATSR